MKLFDYKFSIKFIQKMFDLLSKNEPNSKFLYSQSLLDEINYVKPLSSYKSLTEQFITTIQSKISYED